MSHVLMRDPTAAHLKAREKWVKILHMDAASCKDGVHDLAIVQTTSLPPLLL